MFNKKPRRNFSIKPSKLPQNKSDSSGAEDVVEDSGPFAVTRPPNSKENKDGRKNKENVLSFSDDKEGSGIKLKKWSDKAVVFQARRKEASPAKTSRPNARRDVTVVASPKERTGSDVSGEELSPESDGDAKSTTSSSASSMSSIFSKSSRSSKSSTQKHKPVVIPDSRRIQAARRQRQKARAQKDYISLGRDGESSPRNPDHEDLEERSDEGDEDKPDDHERRIKFAPRSKTIRERIAEKMGGSECLSRCISVYGSVAHSLLVLILEGVMVMIVTLTRKQRLITCGRSNRLGRESSDTLENRVHQAVAAVAL
ncbi:hypothetical protein J4Q44_G00227350 [Coregonus suidteri]|uniref:Uncharacterized protein n=1 Tax=Coregonus suidteri TaxID=861788 RepID=A0AAN8LFL0_9TELE